MFEEVDVARSLHRPVIPIGATFGAARELWRQMKRDPNALHPSIPRAEFELLGDVTATPNKSGWRCAQSWARWCERVVP